MACVGGAKSGRITSTARAMYHHRTAWDALPLSFYDIPEFEQNAPEEVQNAFDKAVCEHFKKTRTITSQFIAEWQQTVSYYSVIVQHDTL